MAWGVDVRTVGTGVWGMVQAGKAEHMCLHHDCKVMVHILLCLLRQACPTLQQIRSRLQVSRSW